MRNMPISLMPLALPAHLLLTAYVLARSPSRLTTRIRGLKDAFAQPSMWGAPAGSRPASIRVLARALSWSPRALSRRAVVARRIGRWSGLVF
jgi:hypothetical protein